MNAVPATVTADGEIVTPKFTPPALKKIITVFHRKMTPGTIIYVKITGPIEDAKDLKNAPARPSDAGKKRQQLMQVYNLETEQPEQITVGFVLKDTLDEAYPKNGYVNKYFRIGLDANKASKADSSRRYNTYSVAELEAPTAAK